MGVIFRADTAVGSAVAECVHIADTLLSARRWEALVSRKVVDTINPVIRRLKTEGEARNAKENIEMRCSHFSALRGQRQPPVPRTAAEKSLKRTLGKQTRWGASRGTGLTVLDI